MMLAVGRVILLAAFGLVSGQTYYPVAYKSLNCWPSNRSKLLASAEENPLLGGDLYRDRQLAISKCARVAAHQTKTYFALLDSGKCFTLCEAESRFVRYGEMQTCPTEGKGGPDVIHLYKLVRTAEVQLEDLGCWRDNETAAIPKLESQDPVLDGPYKLRKEPFAKCVQAAYRRSFEVLALQYGGWCASSANASDTYKKYGPSDRCEANGKGGGWSNHVYRVRAYNTVHFPGS